MTRCMSSAGALLVGLLAGVVLAPPLAAQENDPGKPYATVYYPSGSLRIEAYLYRPAGTGPAPVVVYNHGSRGGKEREEIPFAYVANMLVAHGYAVLVPERRGYGKSDGPTFGEEVGSNKTDKLTRRFEEEAGDVLAGLEYLKSVPSFDLGHAAIMGWSHGGVVSVVAASQSHAFRALVDQAGGALSWKNSPALQRFLKTTARKIKIPTLCQDAKNDATTEAVRATCAAVRASGTPEKTIVYPPFTPQKNEENIAPGHLIFGNQGMPIWQDDVISFLKPHLLAR